MLNKLRVQISSGFEQLELSSETVKIEAPDSINQQKTTSSLPLEVEIVIEGEEKRLSVKPSTPVAKINSTRKLKPEKNKAKIKSANHHQPQLKVELVMEMNTDIEQTAPVSEMNLYQQPQHPINIVFEVSPTHNQAPHQSMNKKINNSRKEFYRQKYLLFKRLIEQKLQIQDQKLIDKTIAELVFRQTGATDEVRATLSQSDLLISLLDNLSEEQYREIVWEYVDKLAREVEREVEYER